MDVSTTGLLIAIFYGFISASMAFVNKAVLTTFDFDYPYFLVTCQMVFAIVILEIMRLSQKTSLQPFTFERGKWFLMPSIFYAVHSVLALTALSGMNIPMYGVIKRCTPVVILILGSVVLKKGFPNPLVIISVTLITTGCIIAGYGDLSFDLKAYAYGVVSVFTQAIYLILVQKYGSEMGAGETLHLNSYNTLPLLMTCALANGELVKGVRNFQVTNIAFVCTFTMVIAVGCLLNYLLFLCTTYNSALTTSITGSLKAIVQTIIGFFTFGGISINVFTIFGISLNITGGLLYTGAKYYSNKKKEALAKQKRVESENNLVKLGNGYVQYGLTNEDKEAQPSSTKNSTTNLGTSDNFHSGHNA